MSRKIEKLSGLAVVTGASSGIGLELAKLAAHDGCALILAADTDLSEAEAAVRLSDTQEVQSLRCDLATEGGIDQLIELIGDRPVEALFANAGHGGGGAFLDQDWNEAEHIVNTDITGTIRLIQYVGRGMRARNRGRILVTGSIAGHIPGSYHLVYNSTKAFLNDFCHGLRNELKDTAVVITCLEPGVTDTEFFDRARLQDTKVGLSDDKADPTQVAQDGYDALLRDDDKIVSGWMNKFQALFSDILPDTVVAEMHRRLAEPSPQKQSELA